MYYAEGEKKKQMQIMQWQKLNYKIDFSVFFMGWKWSKSSQEFTKNTYLPASDRLMKQTRLSHSSSKLHSNPSVELLPSQQVLLHYRRQLYDQTYDDVKKKLTFWIYQTCWIITWVPECANKNLISLCDDTQLIQIDYCSRRQNKRTGKMSISGSRRTAGLEVLFVHCSDK